MGWEEDRVEESVDNDILEVERGLLLFSNNKESESVFTLLLRLARPISLSISCAIASSISSSLLPLNILSIE